MQEETVDVNRVCSPYVHVSVESQGVPESQQTTLVGIALEISRKKTKTKNH